MFSIIIISEDYIQFISGLIPLFSVENVIAKYMFGLMSLNYFTL